MKSLHQTIMWLLLLLTAAFVGCRKENNFRPPASAPVKEDKIASIRVDNFFRLFRYNGEGKLTEIIDSSGDSRVTSKTFLEYSNGRLNRMLYGNITFTYGYSNNNTVEVKASNQSNAVITREVFQYVANRLSEYIRYDGTTGEPDIKAVFTYDSEGNIVKMEDWVYDYYQTREWSKVGQRLSAYDDKVNLSSGLEAYQLPFVEKNMHLNKNNPVKDEWYDGNNHLINTYRYKHDYDSKGRKTKRTRETVVNDRVTNSETTWFTYQ